MTKQKTEPKTALPVPPTEVIKELAAVVEQKEVVSKEMETLEKIQLLANFANSVQDPALKAAFLALNNGETLYHIFVGAVSKQIETMMNPQKAAPKELVDTLTVANNLRTQIVHMYNAMAELSRAPIIGVLSVLNTSIGGKAIQQPQTSYQGDQSLPEDQQAGSIQQQPRQAQQQQNNNGDEPVRTVRRGNNTGITW